MTAPRCVPSAPCGACDFCTEDPELLAGVRNGAWLDAQHFPPLRYHVDRVVPEGLTLNVGPPKIGKSWLVLSYGLAIAAGGRVLGNVAVDPRPVLYLALEDGDRRLQDRARKLLEGDPIPSAFEYLTRVQPGRLLDTIRAWLARHPGAEPFVVLDTLGKIMPPALLGESSYQRDYRIGSALKAVADEHDGAGLLVNHHDRKASSDDFVQAVSGTHGLAGAADTIVVLARRRHDPSGVLQVTGRDVIEGEYAVRFDGGCRWLLDGTDFDDATATLRTRRDTETLGDRSTAIIGYARSKAPATITAKEIAERYDLAVDDAGRYLRRLADTGRLTRATRGRFTVPLSEVSEVSDAGNVVVGLFGQTDTTDTLPEDEA
jgi:hypothetical protein